MKGLTLNAARNRLPVEIGTFSLACLAIFLTSPAYGSVCSFDVGNSTKALTFTVPLNLTVPRDAANGTVIWKSEPQLTPSGHSWSCAARYKYGMVNAVGDSASANARNVLPIGDTGLAWRWAYNDILYGGEMPAGNDYFFNVKYPLELIKIAPVKEGASISSGVLGYMSVNNEVNVLVIKTSNKSSVATLSCKTPDVTVKMGDQNYVGRFKGIGTSLAPVKFSIALKECPEGVNKVSYQLNPNTAVVDATRSVIALDANSTAKGVGLQLLDNAGNPVALKTKLQFKEYDKLGGNFNIPFQAAYHQTAAAVVPGTANTSITFVMSYD